MKLIGIALLAMSTSAFASSNAYDLKMDLSLEGKHVSSPRMIVKEGEPATVIEESGKRKQFIEVTATEGSVHEHKGILLKFTVGTIDENGVRTIITKPQVFAKEGEPAKITQTDKKSGVEHLSFSVTAKKI